MVCDGILKTAKLFQIWFDIFELWFFRRRIVQILNKIDFNSMIRLRFRTWVSPALYIFKNSLLLIYSPYTLKTWYESFIYSPHASEHGKCTTEYCAAYVSINHVNVPYSPSNCLVLTEFVCAHRLDTFQSKIV